VLAAGRSFAEVLGRLPAAGFAVSDQSPEPTSGSTTRGPTGRGPVPTSSRRDVTNRSPRSPPDFTQLPDGGVRRTEPTPTTCTTGRCGPPTTGFVQNLGGYAAWAQVAQQSARRHVRPIGRRDASNQVFTLFVGEPVRAGTYAERYRPLPGPPDDRRDVRPAARRGECHRIADNGRVDPAEHRRPSSGWG